MSKQKLSTIAPDQKTVGSDVFGFREAMNRAGINFKMPEKGYDYAAIAGKKCFGSLLRAPNVFGAESFAAAASDLSPVAKRAMQFQALDGSWVESKRSVALVDEADGAEVNTVSKDYNVVQDADLVREASDAVSALGLTAVGSVRRTSHRLHAALVIADPEYVIPIMEKHDRTIAAGFSFTNSYTSDLGIHVEAAGIDAFCLNFNPWGKTVAEKSMSHLTAGDLTKEVRAVLEEALRCVPKVAAMYREAGEIEVVAKDVRPILAGAGFKETAVDYVEKMKGTLEPMVKTVGLSTLTLNLAATAYVTHVADTTPISLREQSRSAMRILTEDVDRLGEKGRAILAKWAEERDAREKETAEKKAAKATPTTGVKP